MNTSAIDLYLIVLVIILGAVMPFTGIWKYDRLRRWIAAGRANARLASYRWVMIIDWMLTLGFLMWWQALGRSAIEAGLGLTVTGWQWAAVGVGLGLIIFMIVQLVMALRRPDELLKARGKMAGLEPLVPRTRGERTAFSALSVTAGICEEILYRGLLMGSLLPVIGMWPAVVLSSIIFGLGHAYQGSTGILKTATVGLVMALLVVFSGSLWTAIVLHAVVDLTSGRIMSAALDVPVPRSSDQTADQGPPPELT